MERKAAREEGLRSPKALHRDWRSSVRRQTCMACCRSVCNDEHATSEASWYVVRCGLRMVPVNGLCLPEFIGVGEMIDPRTQDLVLFTVQEFVSGGSMDARFWGTSFDSVT